MKDTDRTLNAKVNKTNDVESQSVMFPPFEVKIGAQYLADTQEFAVQGEHRDQPVLVVVDQQERWYNVGFEIPIVGMDAHGNYLWNDE